MKNLVIIAVALLIGLSTQAQTVQQSCQELESHLSQVITNEVTNDGALIIVNVQMNDLVTKTGVSASTWETVLDYQVVIDAVGQAFANEAGVQKEEFNKRGFTHIQFIVSGKEHWATKPIKI